MENFNEFVVLIVGNDINIKNKEKIFLIIVCDGGYFNVLKLLMKLGVEVDLKENDIIIFKYLCYLDYLNIVKRLI